ncbi:hypothetical protein CONPUDRAFT_166321 [Coniophora puteana RWD-64-598 SS2]|uniref:Uncharacterized protein n=1 Tax=Coniophora puteana (strain RWD-64-598) TaxID=741705 RepID=A0A5M3ML91_CONPW|nr:uncharacterized protein CONPUDRAFT_166321 [Coniophora puteana RWD-64-598 SS2]EIW79574.1 hypothetical protein CONPUDRAFT_166321 [Coniophora puteana RWD-64-598 SS2]
MKAYEEDLLFPDRILPIEPSELDSLPENWRNREPLRRFSHRCENVPFREDLSFELSHTFEYLGRAHLILYDSSPYHGRLLLSKGGLYFLHNADSEARCFLVFPGGTTLDSILACIRESPDADFSALQPVDVSMRCWSSNDTEDTMSYYTVAERRDHYRNRFQDMRCRGGHPSMWLTNGAWLADSEEMDELGYDDDDRWKELVPALPALKTKDPQ